MMIKLSRERPNRQFGMFLGDVRELSGAEDVEDEQSEMIQLRAAGFLTSSGPRETRHRHEARNPPAFVSTAY